jgi:hypothetical protein
MRLRAGLQKPYENYSRVPQEVAKVNPLGFFSAPFQICFLHKKGLVFIPAGYFNAILGYAR